LPGEISSVRFFKDEKRLVSRSMDDTMKLWDIRNSKEPMKVWRDLTNLNAKTGVCISPDETIILTGTSVRKGFAYG
jgi:WD40 repeat protein